jgi:hypothetical protein
VIDANGGNSGFPRILFYTLNTRNIEITYEELTTLVNDRYRDLENKGEKNIHQKLKDEFNLTTSEVWELTGLKDLLEFSE